MSDVKKNDFPTYDVIIIGGGPAAMTAALYVARAGLSVRTFEREAFGGAMTKAPKLENYPGFMGKGEDLAKKMREQAEKMGAEFSYGECTRLVSPTTEEVADLPGELEEGIGIKRNDNFFILVIDGEEYHASAVIVATGTQPRVLDLPVGIDKPVSTCVTCDGPLYKDKRVAVIGGGESAVSAAIYLSNIAEFVDVINRSPLKAGKASVEKLSKKKNVTIHEQLDPQTPSAEYKQILRKADGVFMFLGSEPATRFFNDKDLMLGDSPEGSINAMRILRDKMLDRFNFPGHEDFTNDLIPHFLDQSGFIHTTLGQETVVRGLFAAGDVCASAERQVVSAAAAGMIAAKSAIRFLEDSTNG